MSSHATRSWHVITCEFPPMIGGVSDHTRVLAQAAASRGVNVHVWAPSGAAELQGVNVHATLGSFDADARARTEEALNRHAAPRHLLLQWVPHGYGWRGMNVAFSRWIAHRVRLGDRLDVIVHEPFVPFTGMTLSQPVRAACQRYMARVILRAATRVWVSIPGWEARLRSPWVGANAIDGVLSVPGTIDVHEDDAAARQLRQALLGPDGRHVIGYFGAGGPFAESALAAALYGMQPDGLRLVCFGRGSNGVADRLAAASTGWRTSISGTGELSSRELSRYLQACDLLLQPYQDGVSGRRTTTISALAHGVPVATTVGPLSEPFWRGEPALSTVPVSDLPRLARAVRELLDPARNASAREAARRLYAARFDPAVAFEPLFAG